MITWPLAVLIFLLGLCVGVIICGVFGIFESNRDGELL